MKSPTDRNQDLDVLREVIALAKEHDLPLAHLRVGQIELRFRPRLPVLTKLDPKSDDDEVDDPFADDLWSSGTDSKAFARKVSS